MSFVICDLSFGWQDIVKNCYYTSYMDLLATNHDKAPNYHTTFAPIICHELARFESIPHVQCLWACGHMEIASFDVFEWCVILVFGMFCFAEIAVSSDKSIIIRALGCARTHRLWVGNEANPVFPCRFAHTQAISDAVPNWRLCI